MFCLEVSVSSGLMLHESLAQAQAIPFSAGLVSLSHLSKWNSRIWNPPCSEFLTQPSCLRGRYQHPKVSHTQPVSSQVLFFWIFFLFAFLSISRVTTLASTLWIISSGPCPHWTFQASFNGLMVLVRRCLSFLCTHFQELPMSSSSPGGKSFRSFYFPLWL